MSKEVAERCCKAFKTKTYKAIKASGLYKSYIDHCDRFYIMSITQNMFGRIAKKKLNYIKLKDFGIYLPTNPAQSGQKSSTSSKGGTIEKIKQESYEQEIIKMADLSYHDGWLKNITR